MERVYRYNEQKETTMREFRLEGPTRYGLLTRVEEPKELPQQDYLDKLRESINRGAKRAKLRSARLKHHKIWNRK